MSLPQCCQILLVDRERDRRVLVRNLLRACGDYDVISSASIMGALEKIKTHKVDLVLASDDLDVWGGLEFARIIANRCHERGRAVPLILMARRSSMSTQDCAATSVVAAQLVRPFSPNELAMAIQKAVDCSNGTEINRSAAL